MALISIVVPVYFNSGSLRPLHERLAAVATALPDDVFEFVLVDDGSGDDSFSILTELSEKDARVRALRLSRNFGSNAAILAGLTHCRGDAVVVISADLQDPPEKIPDLIARWRQGCQVVMAARRARQDPWPDKLLAAAANRLLRRFVFPGYPPDGFDFVLIDRRVRDILARLQEKNSYIYGQMLWAGFKRDTIFYDRQARSAGKSRWTFSKKIKYFIDIFTGFSYLPLRLASLAGLMLSAVGFLYALLIVTLRIMGKMPVVGWSALAVVVLITSGTQLLILGVLGEYLWRSLDETRRRPPFIVAEHVNVDPVQPNPPPPRPVPGP
jgi:dolichol-phosphate mannosyltransferase